MLEVRELITEGDAEYVIYDTNAREVVSDKFCNVQDAEEFLNAMENTMKIISSSWWLHKSYKAFGYKIMVCKKWNNDYKVLIKDREGNTMPWKIFFKIYSLKELWNDVKQEWSK